MISKTLTILVFLLVAASCRKHTFNFNDLGGVGDGKAINTPAFRRAMATIDKVGGDATLLIPKGIFLTGAFNLTSHMTLFLQPGALILGIPNYEHFPIVAPIPSFGQGRDHPGPRFGALITGFHLVDVEIASTDTLGVIDGNGKYWWDIHESGLERYTRGSLIEFLYCQQISMHDITLRNSPFWTVHPFASEDLKFVRLNIVNPLTGAPNTDGIDPDSSSNVLIQDCVINTGDDAIAIKSGWDKAGYTFNMPSRQIVIKNLTAQSPSSAGIAIGSEMSGGVTDVLVDGATLVNCGRSLYLKSSRGRGGYITNIVMKNIKINGAMKDAIAILDNYGDHPKEGFDPNAVPLIKDITFSNIEATLVSNIGVHLLGLEDALLFNLKFEHIHLGSAPFGWDCSYVMNGTATDVRPDPCPQITPI